MSDHYATLGVDVSASQGDIKRAYKAMSRKWHPDTNKDGLDTTEIFTGINAAYEVLKDPDKRSVYDIAGDEAPLAERLLQDVFSTILETDFDEKRIFCTARQILIKHIDKLEERQYEIECAVTVLLQKMERFKALRKKKVKIGMDIFSAAITAQEELLRNEIDNAGLDTISEDLDLHKMSYDLLLTNYRMEA